MALDAVVNARDHAGYSQGIYRYPRHRYVLWFGSGYGPATNILVYADSLEAALGDAAQEIAERWPGLFTEPDYQDAFEDLQQDGTIPEGWTWAMVSSMHPDTPPGRALQAVMEHAEADLTYTESGWIASWEWGIVAEDPTRKELLAIAHEGCDMAARFDRHQHPMAKERAS